MAQVNESTACLRVWGESLEPNEVTKILGCEPSGQYRKGDSRVSRTTGKTVVYKTGSWRLEAQRQSPEGIDVQVQEILGKLNPDIAAWEYLRSKFEIDMFCGLFMERSNEGMDISPSTLSALGERGILLCFDLYGPDEE